jgi:ribosome-associated translation inhibitor RaiA
MGSADFYVDFNIEVPNMGDEFNREAERQLRKLASDHSDLVGAAVSLERIVKAETSHLYQVRIVVYKRPQDIAVIKQDSDPMATLRDSLEALEEMVRQSRERLDERETRNQVTTEAIYYERTANEVYAAYAEQWDPEEIVNMDRTEIASRLMVEEGLTEEAAYFAADQILRVAEERTSGKEG